MAYTIKCDGYILDDIRDDELTVSDPEIDLEVNTVGGGSFTIHQNHPYYDKLKKLKSVFEVSDDVGVIFRGRMTEDSADFHNSRAVDLEGAMAYFNDSTVRPFSFPEDFADNAEYITAAESGNVIEFFLKWLIDQHNSQTSDFQHFKLGNVTVSDLNNYLSRSSTEYASTWETLKSKLFDSALGGYLCIRYEADGNYIDYLSEFTLTNTQEIVFGENLLNLKTTASATGTYSAMIPLGAQVKTDGESTGTSPRLTIASLPDGNITEDVVKSGDTIYSQSAVEAFGWVCAPTKETTWNDVTIAGNLLDKGVEALTGDLALLTESIEVTAIDLHFTDEQIQTFRIYRNVRVRTDPHGISGTYQLPKLALKLHSPQNTKITVGATKRTLVDINAERESDAAQKIESFTSDLKNLVSNVEKNLTKKIEGIDGTFFYIKYSPYADGHVMTDAPDDSTKYMGTCSTNSSTAPTDYREYTWCRVAGKDGQDGQDGTDGKDGTPGAAGKDGQSQYFHVKYSDDGATFTANGGETLGKWMGTCVDSSPTDPTAFNTYTWRKIVGEDGKSGIDGVDGKDGQSTFFYVKFSANANGNPMTETPDSNTKYMGVCSTTAATAPTSYSAYKWTQCRGNDGTNGTPGAPGADGRTQYLHIKYSDDGETFTENNGETLGAWIGTLVDFNEADSTTFSDYTWKKFTEDVDEELDSIRQTIVEQNTQVLNDAESIILSALKKYVETSNHEEFRQSVESELLVMADRISMTFNSAVEQITNVNGDLQAVVEVLEKHFDFSTDGLTIKAGENSMSLLLDNDVIRFKKNGQEFGWWDGVNFHTGNIYVDVDQVAQFGNYGFVPYEDSTTDGLDLVRVGG